jgi:hypothetical protein
MVGHEHPRVNGNRVFLTSFTQPVCVSLDVGFLDKADLPIVAPV